MLVTKVLSLCRHSCLTKYAIRSSCFSRYVQISGNSRCLKNSFQSFPKPHVLSHNVTHAKHCFNASNSLILQRYKHDAAGQSKDTGDLQNPEEPPEKLSLFKRYQKMLKEYWYVLIPVHMVTSAFWFGGFYYAAKCGIDIIPFLEYINLPEKFIDPLRNSSLGHIAVASALYKLATPARYMVTLGGTTFAVKFLTKRELIKPVPTKAEIKTIIQNKLRKENKVVEKDK